MRMSQSFQQDLTLAEVFISEHKMSTEYWTTSEIKTYMQNNKWMNLVCMMA